VNTTCYLVNHSPSTTIECKTPNEIWLGKSSNYSSLKIFGYLAYYHVKEGKLESKAKQCIFVGYANWVKGYKLWCSNPQSSKFIISRDVTFMKIIYLNRERLLLSLQVFMRRMFGKRWRFM